MDFVIDVFIDFPLQLFNTEFSLFGYTISFFQIFIFVVLAGIGAYLIRNIF